MHLRIGGTPADGLENGNGEDEVPERSGPENQEGVWPRISHVFLGSRSAESLSERPDTSVVDQP
jgi:hypothetical protein